MTPDLTASANEAAAPAEPSTEPVIIPKPEPVFATHAEWMNDMSQPLMVIDTETTGLDHKTEQLIEIAAARMENGEVVDTFSMLVKPTVPIRGSSYKIHGISEEMLENEPGIEDVLPKFLEFMGDTPFVAHNAIFDYSFISQAHKQLYGKRWKVTKIDSLDMYRSVFPEEHSHGLSSMLARFGFESFVSHRALDDALNLAKAFPRLAELYRQKHGWQFSQFDNIPYLLERYHRLQKAIGGMQSEMNDLRDVFKLYFLNGGQKIQCTNGEVLAAHRRRYYEYNDARVWEILHATGLVEKATKINTRALDRIINNPSIDDDIRDQILDARTEVNSSLHVQFIKPSPPKEPKASEPEPTDAALEATAPPASKGEEEA